jgi:hypothetical protein
MKNTERQIDQLRVMLDAETLLSYAPSLRRAWLHDLDRLLMQRELAASLRVEMMQEINTMKEGFSETLALEAGKRKAEDVSRFLLGTFLLSESFAYLHRQPEESLHLVTGVTVGKTCTVETLVPVALSRATVVAAEADGAALASILADLDRLGHNLTAIFHIHPGEGIETTRPSGVDRDYMKRLAGRSVVFGIWSRDGYCRVLTVPSDTKVQLFGDGVTEIRKDEDAHIYKLDNPGKSLLGFNARSSETLVVGRRLVRPAGTN